jgi:hypothetical protein
VNRDPVSGKLTMSENPVFNEIEFQILVNNTKEALDNERPRRALDLI